MATVLERKSKTKSSANGKAKHAPQAKARPKKPAPESTEKLLTAEEYWETCDIENTELVDGKVVELMPPGFDHGEIAANIVTALNIFLRKNKLGRISVEGGFTLRRRPDTVRGPDVSFISYEKLGDQSTHAFIEGAPTLAVEVVSPSDLWSEVENKVQLYLETGTEVVWIIDPKTESVTVRTRGESRVYSKTETLLGEPILPGFKLQLKEIFSS
jgi:Uma2 family endonuclease